MKQKRSKNISSKKRNIVALLLLFVIYILYASVSWGSENFGSINMEEIVFTLSMSLEGSGSDFITDYFVKVLIPGLIVALIFAVDILRNKKYAYKVEVNKKHISIYPCRIKIPVLILILVVGLTSVIKKADDNFGFIDYVKSKMHPSTFIEENYVNPNDVRVRFPDKKRNLIYILMESAESSNQDIENGGLFNENYISEMTQIAKDNVSFSQDELITGATVAPACGWTMAGMMAEFSGIPLKIEIEGNSMDKCEKFFPGLTNMGDILAEEGYKNYYMIGSDARFSGRDKYMTQHGNYEIWDYYTAMEQKKIDEDYCVWWGYEDQKLYDYAKEELTRISQNDEPFNFTMLTVDTHHVAGYVCPLCEEEFSEQYANVWACASRQVNDFVEWIKEQPFYENTTIVICGDHLSMDPDFYNTVPVCSENEGKSRKVYNAIINSPIEPVNEKNRKFVTIDMFPTTLAALNVEIEGNRLGLGTNLFSNEKTLSEEFGYDEFFTHIRKDSKFYTETFLKDSLDELILEEIQNKD